MISSNTNILKVWEDGSVFKVIALLAQRHELGSLAPHKNWYDSAYVYKPSTVGRE